MAVPARKKEPDLRIPSAGDPSFRWVAVVFLILIEIMLYARALFSGLVGYDYIFRELASRPLVHLWTEPTDILARWRPLAYSINRLLFVWFGESPIPWHGFSLLLHLASVLLFFRIALKLSEEFQKPGVFAPVAVTALFQIHAASVQNVYWASGFSDLLSLFFLLSAISIALRQSSLGRFRVLTGFGVLCASAVLSKESAVVFPFFLFLLFALKEGSVKAALQRNTRLIGLSFLISILFGILYIVVAGAQLADRPSPGINESLLILLRGIAMLSIPTDALSIYQLALANPWAVAVAALAYIAAVVALIRLRVLTLRSLVLLVITLLVGLSVYVVGHYVSLRLMYQPMAISFLAGFLILNRHKWMQGSKREVWILIGFVWLYGIATAAYSVSAVLDWHVADKYGKAVKASFIEYHQVIGEGEYVFAAIPSRLRQAEIVGEPAADFRGELRQHDMADTVRLRSVLRIVLLDRDDPSANVKILKTSDRTVILQTQTENQFFLAGTLDSPLEMHEGTVFSEGEYTVEVLETVLGGRASAVQISVTDPPALERLLFYDDETKSFLPYSVLEVNVDDGENE